MRGMLSIHTERQICCVTNDMAIETPYNVTKNNVVIEEVIEEVVIDTFDIINNVFRTTIHILSLLYAHYHSYSEIKSDLCRVITNIKYLYLIYNLNTRVMKPVTANTIAHHSTLINDYLLDRFSINTFLYFICRHEVHIFTIHLLISHGNIKKQMNI